MVIAFVFVKLYKKCFYYLRIAGEEGWGWGGGGAGIEGCGDKSIVLKTSIYHK
jgi:hypothetical protein